jgi:hypothetical protein
LLGSNAEFTIRSAQKARRKAAGLNSLTSEIETKFMTYRGSNKHKNRPTGEIKGTLCPEWTHHAGAEGYAHDPYAHPWLRTEAHQMFEESEPDPGGKKKRWAIRRGIAFAAQPTGDGTWHGYPTPWSAVPPDLKAKWQDAGKVRPRELKRYNIPPEDDIRWALEIG